MKYILALFAVAILYLAVSPFITVHQIRSAADDRDAEALSEQVDFPALRRNMKEQLRFAVLDGATDAAEENALAAIGVAIGGVLLDGLVDLWVTPAGVMKMMKGDKPQNDDLRGKPTEHEESDVRKALRDATWSYASWDRFVIEVPNDAESVTKFVLRRQGLGWKLTNIILPLDG
jgi:hypothetical protein